MDDRFEHACDSRWTIVNIGKFPSFCPLRNFAYIYYSSMLSPKVLSLTLQVSDTLSLALSLHSSIASDTPGRYFRVLTRSVPTTRGRGSSRRSASGGRAGRDGFAVRVGGSGGVQGWPRRAEALSPRAERSASAPRS